MFLPYLFLTACFASVTAVLWAMVAALLMLRHFKVPSDRFSTRTLWNPMNVLVRPELLTDAGLRYRRHVGYAMSVFIGCFALAGLIGVGVTLTR